MFPRLNKNIPKMPTYFFEVDMGGGRLEYFFFIYPRKTTNFWTLWGKREVKDKKNRKKGTSSRNLFLWGEVGGSRFLPYYAWSHLSIQNLVSSRRWKNWKVCTLGKILCTTPTNKCSRTWFDGRRCLRMEKIVNQMTKFCAYGKIIVQPNI